MGGHRRSEVEVMRDILVICLEDPNKTKIVYKANLNFIRVNKYLNILLSLGFVVEKKDAPGNTVYGTTEAGTAFLNGCAKMKEASISAH